MYHLAKPPSFGFKPPSAWTRGIEQVCILQHSVVEVDTVVAAPFEVSEPRYPISVSWLLGAFATLMDTLCCLDSLVDAQTLCKWPHNACRKMPACKGSGGSPGLQGHRQSLQGLLLLSSLLGVISTTRSPRTGLQQRLLSEEVRTRSSRGAPYRTVT